MMSLKCLSCNQLIRSDSSGFTILSCLRTGDVTLIQSNPEKGCVKEIDLERGFA